MLKKLPLRPLLVCAHTTYQRVANRLHYGRVGMFSVINVETSSYCNRKCPSCPVSIAPRKTRSYMSAATYDRILRELAAINYRGRFSLHSYNEPLADETIVTKVRRAREQLPRATLTINSNGDFLTPERLKDLHDAGLDLLFVTAYGENAYKRLLKLHEAAKPGERALMELRLAKEFVGNRGGSLNDENDTLKAGCFMPSSQMVINYKSEVVICCNDYFGDVILGNVEAQGLHEIWYGRQFQEVRAKLARQERESIPPCRKCNLRSSACNRRYLTPAEIKRFNDRGVGKP